MNEAEKIVIMWEAEENHKRVSVTLNNGEICTGAVEVFCHEWDNDNGIAGICFIADNGEHCYFEVTQIKSIAYIEE